MEFDVRTSFVSFVDHLPSDVIRKLWLLQTLNIRHAEIREKLDAHLKELPSCQGTDQYRELVDTITQLSQAALQVRCEALEESKSIATTVQVAKIQLQNQHQQLEHDRKMYQNEMETKEVLKKHSQRNNKRTTSRPPKITLKLPAIPQLHPIVLTPQKRQPRRPRQITMPEDAKRKRGRPRKYSLPAEILEPVSRVEDEEDEVYCICQSPSYGEMVACDNPKCKYEWFHYGCVGLTRAPRGVWLCPRCRKKKKK